MPAFGRGVRTGEDKLWADAGGRPVFAITLESIAAAGCFDRIVVAAPTGRWDAIRGLAVASKLPVLVLVEGGDSRQESVAAALGRCDGDDWISVHDAARPLTPPALFRAVLDAARSEGAATAGVPCVDTVKQVQHGRVAATLDRASLIATQTPQAFAADLLRRAHRNAVVHGLRGADDATLVEALGEPVAVVAGDPRNFKITFPQDLVLLRSLLEEFPMTPRIGHGIDAHRFIPGRHLMLGGVLVPYSRGLLGHSDGDAVVHALVDAILGASGLGDMGKHFPSSDPLWKDTSGVEFLKVVAAKLKEEGWMITSAHVIAIAEEPRLSPHLQAMSDAMSSALGLEPGTIAVGATTTDGMGFSGRSEGIAASATVLLERR